jgi:hypothetical protein
MSFTPEELALAEVTESVAATHLHASADRTTL